MDNPLDPKGYLRQGIESLSEDDKIELQCQLNLLKYLADSANLNEPPVTNYVRQCLNEMKRDCPTDN